MPHSRWVYKVGAVGAVPENRAWNASHHYGTDDSKEGIAATLPFTVALTEEHLRPSDRTYNGPLSGGEALSRQFLR